ncbi:MAG TPA: adenylosuccinate lyase [Candidatus Limnocylindrales bacterium]|nr:adenylosuccinate lyase [Candidatus Limnocylindrales bacterium]
MIPRYSRPEMSRLWSDENRFATWLRVEIAATEVLAGQGVVPQEALAAIREKARFDVARIEAIEREVQHDVIAFVSDVAESVGPEGRWIHYGLTSSDVVDTALALLMRDATDLIRQDVEALRAVIGQRAREFKDAPMIGRTHGVHAEPMTFGLKLALWYAELGRALGRLARARETIAVGKLSGAVGTFSHLGPEVEDAVCAKLGLAPAPVSSQVLQRDRHAEVMTALAITAASLEKFATEIRALQKTEVREVEEPFGSRQKGSSAMPHKRNPVGCEQVTGLARLVRANAMAALENVALWHERDISHSSVERVIVPDSFLALDHMLRRMTDIVKGMAVHTDRMRRNLDSTRGLVFSGQLLLDLTSRGLRREDAYRVVQGHAMAAWAEEGDFRARVSSDPEVKAVLKPAEIDEVFRLERYLAHVDHVFARVFAKDPAGSASP